MDGINIIEQPRTDGRHNRAERTRVAILRAARDLISTGTFNITMVGVGKRAGVSNRSVFQHFHDIDSLKRVALDESTRRAILALVISSSDASIMHARVIHAAVFGKV